MMLEKVPIKKWGKTKERVRKLLLKFPHLRDDLNSTITIIWDSDMKKLLKKETSEINFIEFLTAYETEKITPVQTITRSWRKMQEQYLELRGKQYEKRHGVAKEVEQKIPGYMHP